MGRTLSEWGTFLIFVISCPLMYSEEYMAVGVTLAVIACGSMFYLAIDDGR